VFFISVCHPHCLHSSVHHCPHFTVFISACHPYCLYSSACYRPHFLYLISSCHHPHCKHSCACHYHQFMFLISACRHPHCLHRSAYPQLHIMFSSLPAAILSICSDRPTHADIPCLSLLFFYDVGIDLNVQHEAFAAQCYLTYTII
jgi:hypothetical protein